MTVSLSTKYTAVGIIYSFIAAISYANYSKGEETSDSYKDIHDIALAKIFRVLLGGNMIVFGFPALFWFLDQLIPRPEFKRIFLYL